MQSVVIRKPFCMKAKTPRCIWINSQTNGIMPCYYQGDNNEGIVRSLTGTVMGSRFDGKFVTEKAIGGTILMIPSLWFYKRVVKTAPIEYIEVYWFDRLDFGKSQTPTHTLHRVGVQFSIFNKTQTELAQKTLDQIKIKNPLRRIVSHDHICDVAKKQVCRPFGFPNSNLGIMEIAGLLAYDTKSYEWVRGQKGAWKQVLRNNFGTELYAIPGIPESFHLNWKEAVKNA